MIGAAVSRKYAQSLAEVALQAGEGDEVGRQLLEFQALLAANEQLGLALASPAVPLANRRNVLREVSARMGLLDLVRNFLLVLLENNRFKLLDPIVEAFQRAFDEGTGVLAAAVVSSRELKPEDQRRLSEKLSASTGKKMKLQFSSDPELIGGLKMQIGSTIYDGTVKTRLEELKKRITGV